MKWSTLTALRDTLAGYTPLNDYASTNLSGAINHVIGNKLRQRPRESEHPFFAYVPSTENLKKLTNTEYESKSQVYIIYGIHEKDLELATQKVLDISEHIKECLRANHTLGGAVDMAYPVRLETDEGYYQPFFYARVLVEILEV